MELQTCLDIMSDFNITSDEFLLIYLTLLARHEEKSHCKYINQWYKQVGEEKFKNIFNQLKDRGFINKDSEISPFDPNIIEFNKNFLKR